MKEDRRLEVSLSRGDEIMHIACPVCNGTGIVVWEATKQHTLIPVPVTADDEKDALTTKDECPACGGTGSQDS